MLDTVVGTALAHEEMVEEVRRARASRPRVRRPLTSVAVDSMHDRVRGEDGEDRVVDVGWEGEADAGEGAPPGPLLVSSCPGWVCFVEKTYPELIPLLSRVRSPQQIVGALVKRAVPRAVLPGERCARLSSREILHVTLMPCFDKKLEASRLDFWDAVVDAHDVDCVVSSVELCDWIESIHGAEGLRSASFSSREGPVVRGSFGSGASEEEDEAREEGVLRRLRSLTADGAEMLGLAEARGGSGGFAVNLARDVWRAETGSEAASVATTPGKNADLFHVSAGAHAHEGGGGAAAGGVLARGDEEGEGGRGPRPVRATAAYGFRNIQGLVTSIKRGKCDADVVEVMACPAGCVNGGGQPPAAPADEERASARSKLQLQKEHTALVDARFHRRLCVPPRDLPAVAFVRRTMLPAADQEPAAFLSTRFHAVPGLPGGGSDLKW